MKGEAHDLVKNITTIENVWERLSDRFGDEIQIVDSVNHDIEKLSIPKQNSDKGFIEFVNILEQGVQDLQSIDQISEIANALTVRLIEKKLPRRVMQKWLDTDRAENGDERFTQIIKFLKHERKQVEQIVLQRSENDSDSAGRGGRVNSQRQQQRKCLLHPNATNHHTRKCRDFKAKTVNERAQLVHE